MSKQNTTTLSLSLCLLRLCNCTFFLYFLRPSRETRNGVIDISVYACGDTKAYGQLFVDIINARSLTRGCQFWNRAPFFKMFALWWSQQPRTSVAASAIVSVFSCRETETASVYMCKWHGWHIIINY